MIRLPTWMTAASPRRDAALLTLAVAVVYAATSDHPALGSSNRYVESCREMVELRDWVVPHLAYVPYFEKPILTYWLGAICQLLFGGGNVAAQLPSGLAALVSVLAAWALGTRLFGTAVGLGAGLLLLGGGLFLATSSVLTTDPILSACLAACWWTWWCWEDGRLAGAPANRWIWGFWLALGLGFLAKGPIALVIAGAGIGGYAFLAGGLKGIFATLWAMRPLAGLVVIAAINLPWSIAVWQRDPRFLEFFYVRINFQAFFDGSVNHPGPPWYYIPVLAGALMPFSLVVLPVLGACLWRAVADAVTRLRRGGIDAAPHVTPVDAAERLRRGRLFLASAVLFPLAFFSVSASKLGTYPMPLFAPIALIVADALSAWPFRRRWWVSLAGFSAVALLVILILAPAAVSVIRQAVHDDRLAVISFCGLTWRPNDTDVQTLRNIDWSWLPALAVMAGVFMAFLAASAWASLRKCSPGWSLALLGTGFAVVAAVMLPHADDIIRDLDGSRMIAVIRAHGGDLAGTPVAEHDRVILHETVVHDYELVHALGRRAYIFSSCRELGMGHFAEVTPPTTPLPDKGQPIPDPYAVSGENLPANAWLYPLQRLKDEWNGPRRLWLVGKTELLDQLTAAGLTFHRIDNARRTILVSNRSDP